MRNEAIYIEARKPKPSQWVLLAGDLFAFACLIVTLGIVTLACVVLQG